jgi:hypothetical protein
VKAARPMRLLAAPVTSSGADWSSAMPLLVAPVHLSLPLSLAAAPIPEVNDSMPTTDALTRSTCLGCHQDVVVVRDVDTSELLQLDAEPVDEGHVAIWAIAGRAVCRRYGRPALRQPAWQVHQCTAPTPAVEQLADGDPYDDESPAMQQARWRQA